MIKNSNQPRAYDVVLGDQIPVPVNGAVLGGLPGVKRRLLNPAVAQRVAALKETLQYGQEGKDLLIWALKDASWQVRQTAYQLLEQFNQLMGKQADEPTLKQALQESNPYQLFQCLYRHPTRQFTAYSIQISPDGQLLISGGSDKIITIRSLSSGKVLRTLSGHSGSVYTVAVTPDGQTVVSGSSDNTIKVWDLRTALIQSRALSDGLICTLSGHSAEVTCVAISLDGKVLVSGSNDTTIQVWQLPVGGEVPVSPSQTLTGHLDEVKSVAMSPDGQILASGSTDETIQLWNLQTGERLQTIDAHNQGVKAMTFSSDGKILVSGGEDKTIKLWQLPTGDLLQTLSGHWGEVNSLSISPDGQTLVSASWDQTIRLWHLATGAHLHSLEEHLDSIAAIAISPDGQKIVSSSWDKTIRVWGAS